MSFPPPAVTSIDWARIGITPREVNGHAQCEYSIKTGQWSQPKFVKDPYLRIHGLAPALNYGQQAYEGLKAFRTPQNEISVFRPEFHAARLVHSMSFVCMPPIPKETFLEAVNLAVAGNAEYAPPHETEALMYIRPVVFGTTAHIALSPPEDYIFCVYAQPGSTYHGVKPLDALILEQFDRAAPFGTGSAKVGGNYAPVYRWSGMAMKEGFALTLHLDSQTRTEIEEFSTSAFIGIKQEGDNVTMVVPDSKNVIASVTSDSCQQLAKSYGWKVEVRPIKFEELATFSEVMAAGTAAALLPVKSITHKSTNSKFIFQDGGDQAGPCCQRLAANMKAIQKGKTEDVNGWCLKIKEVKF